MDFRPRIGANHQSATLMGMRRSYLAALQQVINQGCQRAAGGRRYTLLQIERSTDTATCRN